MSTDATLGYGSQLYYSADGEIWKKLLQTIDLTGPEPEVGDVKITNNDSPANTHEYKPGMIEPGEQELDSIFTAAQMAILDGMLGDGNIYEFCEVYTDSGPSGWHYAGYVKKIGVTTKTEDEANHAGVTIKLTSRPEFNETITVTPSGDNFMIDFSEGSLVA
jgi:hypothetical protein